MKIKSFIALLIILVLNIYFTSFAYAAESSLSCSPSTGSYNTGETFTVDFLLDTRNYPAFGADIHATFDSSVLEAVGSQLTPVTTSTNWGTPTTNTIDASLGKIQLDYGNTQSAATVSASIGQITFKAIASGQAQFNYSYFQPKDDTTPAVAKIWGKDSGETLSNILTEVNNCIYVIGGATVPTPTTSSSIPTATIAQQATATPELLPRTGSVEATQVLLGASFFLLTSGGIIARITLKKD